MILWELASRKLPFDGIEQNMRILNLVAEGKRPPIPTDCPSNFAYLINRCWAQRIEDRPEITEIVSEMEINNQELRF